eukprot:jgi/Bigna1/88229/estExt_fgenesh1_pg.C_290125
MACEIACSEMVARSKATSAIILILGVVGVARSSSVTTSPSISPTRYPTHLPSSSPTQQNLRVCEITLGDLNYSDSSSFNATVAQRLHEDLSMFLNSSTRQVSRSDLIVDYFAVGSGIGVLMKVTSTIPSVYDSLQQASLSQLSQALMTSVSNVRVFMDTYSPTRYPTHLPSYSPTQQNLRVCEITLGDLNYGDSSSFNATIAQRLVENLATFLNKPARPVSRSSLLVDFFAGSVLMRARLPYPQNYDEIQQASLDQLS